MHVPYVRECACVHVCVYVCVCERERYTEVQDPHAYMYAPHNARVNACIHDICIRGCIYAFILVCISYSMYNVACAYAVIVQKGPQDLPCATQATQIQHAKETWTRLTSFVSWNARASAQLRLPCPPVTAIPPRDRDM